MLDRKVLIPTFVACFFALCGVAFLYTFQGSELKTLSDELEEANTQLDRHGAIQVTDRELLHVRQSPFTPRQEELRHRLFIPANQAYRIVVYTGPIDPAKSLPSDSDGALIPFELPSHPNDREVLVMGGVRYDYQTSRWSVTCKIIDDSDIEYLSNGVSIFIPPRDERYFQAKASYRTFQTDLTAGKTAVFARDATHLNLATAIMHELPEGESGTATLGDAGLEEWLKEQQTKPGLGFQFWIERIDAQP